MHFLAPQDWPVVRNDPVVSRVMVRHFVSKKRDLSIPVRCVLRQWKIDAFCDRALGRRPPHFAALKTTIIPARTNTRRIPKSPQMAVTYVSPCEDDRQLRVN